jgi:beta-N-acetylhexosaminidase
VVASALISLFGLVAGHAAPAQRMTARELAGQVILMRFVGNPPQPYVAEALRGGEAAGVVLFRDNATSFEATRRLTRDLRRAGGGDLLIAADQEGGAVRILGWASPAQDQSLVTSLTEARAAARAAEHDLLAAGVNLNLAPVADRSEPGSLMDRRAFPGGPRRVAGLVAAAVGGYRDVGVTLKHFPGLGGADGNTDHARVTVAGRPNLLPFARGIRAGATAVMLSHARYPALDPHAIASQSHAIVTGLLKRRLGFTGVAMTDSLEAYSVRSRMSMERAAVRSVRAGIDLVLTTGQGTHHRVLRALTRAARRRPAFRARLTDAADRVLILRHTLDTDG